MSIRITFERMSNGNRLGQVQNPLGVTRTQRMGEPATLTVDMSQLAEPIDLTVPAVATVEVWDGDGWVEPINGRFITATHKHDRADPQQAHVVAFVSIMQLAEKATVWDNPPLSEDGKRQFNSANAGQMVGALMAEARSRGWSDMLGERFTSTNDGAGQPWALVTTRAFDPATDLMTVIQNLYDSGICDVYTLQDELVLVNPDTALARERTDVWLRTDDMVASPRETKWQDAITHVRVVGDEGRSWVFTEPTTVSPWGRSEVTLEMGGVTDEATAKIAADKLLAEGSGRAHSVTMEWRDAAARFRPEVDFRLGDWILVDTPDGPRERMRVQEIVHTLDADGLSYSVTVGTVHDNLLARLAKRQKGIEGGSGKVSQGRPAPVGEDKRRPRAPEGLVAMPLVTIGDDGRQQGSVETTWQAVELATDGTSIEVSRYRVAWRDRAMSASEIEQDVSGTSYRFGPLQPGTEVTVRVAAQASSSGRWSAWSDPVVVEVPFDDVPPPKPAPPKLSSSMGVLTVEHDWKTFDGGDAPFDQSFLEVRRTVSGQVLGHIWRDADKTLHVSPMDENGNMRWQRGDVLDIAVIAEDFVGNRSPESESASVTVRSVLDDTDFDDRMKDLRDALDQLEQDLEAHDALMDQFEQDMQAHDGQLAQLGQDLQAARDELLAMQQDLQDLIDVTLPGLQDDLGQNEQDLREAEQALEDLEQNRLPALEQQVGDAAQQAADAAAEAVAARNRANEAHGLASQATLDATDAHNRSVEAMEKATATSLLPDGDFPAATSRYWSLVGTSTVNHFPSPWSTGDSALQLVASTAVSVNWLSVPVTGGRTYRLHMKTANGMVRIAGQWTTGSGPGAFTAWTSWADAGTAAAPRVQTIDVTAPAGAKSVRVSFQHDGSLNTYFFGCHMWDVTEALAAQRQAAEASDRAAQALELASASLAPVFPAERDQFSYKVGTRLADGTAPGGGATVVMEGSDARFGHLSAADAERVYGIDVWVRSPTSPNIQIQGYFTTSPTSLVSANITESTVTTRTVPVGEWVRLRHVVTATAAQANVGLIAFARALGATTNRLEVAGFRVVDITGEARSLEAWERSLLAEQFAREALASASGGNHIIVSTLPASGGTNPITGGDLVEGDVWIQVITLASWEAIGQWVWDGSTWQPSMIRSEMITNLDVLKLTVSGSARMAQAVIDRIIADAGFFRLLTAEKLVVGTAENVVPYGALDPLQMNASPLYYNGWSNFKARPDWPGGAVQIDGIAQRSTDFPFTLEKGVTYHIEQRVWAQTPGARTFLQMITTDGGTNPYLVNGWTMAATGDMMTADFTPDRTMTGVLHYYGNHQSGAASSWMLYGPITIRAKASLYVDGSITGQHIAAETIGAREIAASTLLSDKIMANVVLADHLGANTITGTHIAAKTITTSNITSEAITTWELAANSVSARNITAEAVTAIKIRAEAITTEKLAAGAITADKISGKVITGDHLAFRTITSDNIGAQQIRAVNIAADQIGANHIAANQILARHIVAGAIEADHIKAGAITATLLHADAINGKTITGAAVVGSVVRTSATSYRGIIIEGRNNLSQFSGYDGSGNRQFFLNGINGDFQLGPGGNALNFVAGTGNLTISGDLTTRAGGKRVELREGTWPNFTGLRFYASSATGNNHGELKALTVSRGYGDWLSGSMFLTGQTYTTSGGAQRRPEVAVGTRINGAGMVYMSIADPSNGTTASSLQLDSNGITVNGTVAHLPGQNMRFIGLPSKSASFRVVHDSNWFVGYEGSIRAIKTDISPLGGDPYAALALQPVTYVPRDDPAAGTQIGLIAEEVATAAAFHPELDPLALYMDGQLASVAYDRVAVALIPAIRDLKQRLDRLEGDHP